MAGGFAPNNLVQDINPMTWWGNQMGFININTQASGDPPLEAQIVERVASYGRQLGRIGEALEVLLKAMKLDDGNPRPGLSDEDRQAIQSFLAMQRAIQDVKAKAAPTEALVREVQRLKKRVAQMQSGNGRAKSSKRPAARAVKRPAAFPKRRPAKST
ncbi:MAG: hypothetical protein JWP03_200 [Phycisphaerales bacterium]|jgi:hypothetical protein|nr:hypothetical protein [Phycisphaerales bacterium]